MRYLLILILFCTMTACTESKHEIPFTSVSIESFYEDSLSIRAIDIVGNTLRYAANKGTFGNIDLRTGKIMEGIEKYHTSIPEFRAIAHTATDFFMLSVGSPALLYKTGDGGKSLHLAALMENKGQLIAMDIYGSKLKELKRRARRNSAHNIETREITSTKVFKKLYGSADRVLIDAPCTGLGVLRRNPDSKWKMQPEFLEKIIKVQHDIIRSYSKIVKSEGKMVYATCSILPQENNNQVTSFLGSEEGKDFSLVKEKKIYASKDGFDGFYMALLEKK